MAKKCNSCLPEDWISPIRKMDGTRAVVYALGLMVATLALGALIDFSGDPDLVGIALFAVMGGFAIWSYGTAVGHWLGMKWGKKARWQGWGLMMSITSTVSFIIVTLVDKLGFLTSSLPMILGALLWYYTFMSYYRTSRKHAIYSIIILNLLTLVFIIPMALIFSPV